MHYLAIFVSATRLLKLAAEGEYVVFNTQKVGFYYRSDFNSLFDSVCAWNYADDFPDRCFIDRAGVYSSLQAR